MKDVMKALLKGKKGIVLIAIGLLIIACGSYFIVKAATDGKKNKPVDSKVIEIINDHEVTRDEFDFYNKAYKNLSERGVWDRINKNILEYDDAKKSGVSVSEKEVDEFVAEQKKSLQILANQNGSTTTATASVSASGNSTMTTSSSDYAQGKEAYDQFMQQVKDTGMTLDQYLEKSRVAYRKRMLIGKYKQKLKKDYDKKLIDSGANPPYKSFNQYYDEKLYKELAKAKITKFK